MVRIKLDWCKLQVDINDKMRAILVDWLVEVHAKFKVRNHKPVTQRSPKPRVQSRLTKYVCNRSLCRKLSF